MQQVWMVTQKDLPMLEKQLRGILASAEELLGDTAKASADGRHVGEIRLIGSLLSAIYYPRKIQ